MSQDDDATKTAIRLSDEELDSKNNSIMSQDDDATKTAIRLSDEETIDRLNSENASIISHEEDDPETRSIALMYANILNYGNSVSQSDYNFQIQNNSQSENNSEADGDDSNAQTTIVPNNSSSVINTRSQINAYDSVQTSSNDGNKSLLENIDSNTTNTNSLNSNDKELDSIDSVVYKLSFYDDDDDDDYYNLRKSIKEGNDPEIEVKDIEYSETEVKDIEYSEIGSVLEINNQQSITELELEEKECIKDEYKSSLETDDMLAETEFDYIRIKFLNLTKSFEPISSKLKENRNIDTLDLLNSEYSYNDTCYETKEALSILNYFEKFKESINYFKEYYNKFDIDDIKYILAVRDIEKQHNALKYIYNIYENSKKILFSTMQLFNIIKRSNTKYYFFNECKKRLEFTDKVFMPYRMDLNISKLKNATNIDEDLRAYLNDFLDEFDKDMNGISYIEDNIIKPYTDSIKPILSKDVKNYIFILIYKNLNALKSNYAFYDIDNDFKISNGTALNMIYKSKEKIIDLEKDAFRLEEETLEVLNMSYNQYKAKFSKGGSANYKHHYIKIVYYILMKNIFKDGRVDSKYMIFLEFINRINSISLDLEDEISDKDAILKTILDELYKGDSELSKDFENLITYSIIFSRTSLSNNEIYENIRSYLKSRLSEYLYEVVDSLINLDIIKNPDTPLKEQLELSGIRIKQDNKKNIISAVFIGVKNELKSKKEIILLEDFQNILKSFGGDSLTYLDVKYIKNSLKNYDIIENYVIKENDYFSFFEKILRKKTITHNIIFKYILGINNKMNNFLNLDYDNLNYKYPEMYEEPNIYVVNQCINKSNGGKAFKFGDLQINLLNLNIPELEILEKRAKDINNAFNKYISVLNEKFLKHSKQEDIELYKPVQLLEERTKRLAALEDAEKDITLKIDDYKKAKNNICKEGLNFDGFKRENYSKYVEIEKAKINYFGKLHEIKFKKFEELGNLKAETEKDFKEYDLKEKIDNIIEEVSSIQFSNYKEVQSSEYEEFKLNLFNNYNVKMGNINSEIEKLIQKELKKELPIGLKK